MEAKRPLPRFSAALYSDPSGLHPGAGTVWDPIVAEARKGDPGAKETIVRVHYRHIHGLISRLVRDQEEAADLTQETFLRAFLRLDELKIPASLSWWLRSIATNLCRESYRRRYRLRSLLFSRGGENTQKDGDAWEPVDESLSPEDAAVRAEMRRRVRTALRSLPPDQKEVVLLHHVQGVRVEDIARLVGCPVGTVKSRLSRGRARLSAELQPLAA